jgi:hypothetical protein
VDDRADKENGSEDDRKVSTVNTSAEEDDKEDESKADQTKKKGGQANDSISVHLTLKKRMRRVNKSPTMRMSRKSQKCSLLTTERCTYTFLTVKTWMEKYYQVYTAIRDNKW